jgi:hypothetical protein
MAIGLRFKHGAMERRLAKLIDGVDLRVLLAKNVENVIDVGIVVVGAEVVQRSVVREMLQRVQSILGKRSNSINTASLTDS